MEQNRIEELIKNGRNFMKKEVGGEDFESDQMKKLPQPPLTKRAITNHVIALPTNFHDLRVEQEFFTIINNRKSSRVFTNEKMSLLELSYLLWVSQGVKEVRGKSYATLRTVPSAGARHPYETYMIIQNVEGLVNGKYHYLPMKHEIECLEENNQLADKIGDSLSEQTWANKAAVVFYFACDAYRCEWRYGIYAHRPALIDAGHIGQNLYLGCSALQLGTCGIAAFENSLCNDLFSLDGENEFVVYAFPVGKIKAEDKAKEDAFYAFVKEEGL